MMFKTHTKHVQENAHHDEDVEFLVGGQIKEESGNWELAGERKGKARICNDLALVITRGLGKALVGFLFPIFFIAL